MLVSPLAGASGALPPAHLTLAGQLIVCVPPAVISSVRRKAVFDVLGTLVNEKVVVPVVLKLNTDAAEQSMDTEVPVKA